MERASRLIVVASIALAVATHVWLGDWQPGVRLTAIAAFVLSAALARVSVHGAFTAVAGTAFVAPALLSASFDTSDYHQTIVWLAAVAGLVVARADVSRWSVPRNWMAPLAAWAVLVALTWPIVAARELDFGLATIEAAGLTNPLLQASPRVAAAYVVIFSLTHLIGIVWIDCLWAVFRERPHHFARFVAIPLVVSGVLGGVVGLYQRFVDLSWMNLPIWTNMQRAGGLMNDANAFGTGAAFLAPLAIALAWSVGRATWLASMAMAILTAGMWAAGSRTALIVFAIGSGALVIAALREQGLWQPRIGRLVAATGVAAFILAAAVVPRDFESSNPIERAFARVPQLESEDIRRFANELWVRFGYGRAANQMIGEHPIAGVGVGAFHLIAPEYIYRDTGRVLPSDNAQNWWRQQLAELGVVGGVPSLWFSLVIALLCRRQTTPPPNRTATVLRGSLIGLGVVSLVGVPTQSAAITLAFGSVLFWLASVVPGSHSQTERHAPWTSIAIAVLIVAVVTSLAVSARGSLRVPHRALRVAAPYSYGLLPAQEVSAYGDVRWMAAHAVSVVPRLHRYLQLTLWAPYPDVATRPVEFELAVNGQAPFARTLTNPGPTTLFVEVPAGASALLEMRASREMLPGRALQLAISWRETLPAGVTDRDVSR